MHDTRVVMKNGQEFCSPMWLFRPKEGYMTLIGVHDDLALPLKKLHFRDMKSAVTEGVMARINVIADRDEIARAREQGWDGK